MSVIGKKIYLQPKGTVLDAISDLAELQKGKVSLYDIPNGKIHYCVKLYHNKWECRFNVTDMGKSRCLVELELDRDDNKTECMINREYAILDAMLIERAKIELSEKEMVWTESARE